MFLSQVLPSLAEAGNMRAVNESVPDKPQNEPSAPVPTPEPVRPVEGARGWMLKAGEWLQRPPGKHMAAITITVILVVMFLLVWIGSWFS